MPGVSIELIGRDPASAPVSHEVSVMCLCDNADDCALELYISDVRILERRLAETMALSSSGSPLVPPQFGSGGNKAGSGKRGGISNMSKPKGGGGSGGKKGK